MLLTLISVLTITSLILIYLYFKASFKKWTELNVPNLPAKIPFGNFTEIATKKLHFTVVAKNLYAELKKLDSCTGVYLFTKPYLFVSGPEFAKTILIRDFNSFMNHGLYFNPEDDPISGNIFFQEDYEWLSVRQKLSFAFTSGKMKMMFNTLVEVGDVLVDYIKTSGVLEKNQCDIKELMACFTTDVVSSCIFGLQGNNINNPESDFRYYSKRVMNFSPLKNIQLSLATSFRKQARKLRFRVFDKQSSEFFHEIVKKTIAYRRENNIKRNDLMQILIGMISQEPGEGLSLDEVVANSFIFFFAGFETSSTTISVALYHLALNQDIQDEVRAEINKVLDKDEKLSYENLYDMHLLERIVLETLRMHPPIAALFRISNKPYTLPNGSEIPEGTNVIIPVLGFHYDSDIWPNPEKFDPNRFTDEEKHKRHPYAFLPFGEGMRICIGQRFALMQAKVGLVKILKDFRVEVCVKTEIPLTIDPGQPTYVPNNVWLKLSPLNDKITTEL